MNRIVGGIRGGLPLLGIGASLLSIVWSGQNLFYVRSGMTVPLVVAGVVLVGLGLAAMTRVAVPHHVPKSAIVVAIPVLFLLVVQPGPLSVDTGLAYDGFGRVPARTSIVIPAAAVVGVDASIEQIGDKAVELDPTQFQYAAEQLSAQFGAVALRMIGQVIIDSDGIPRLVRFRIICCAADAVRVWVKLDRPLEFDPGTWVSVTGQWDSDTTDPGIRVASAVEIDRPDNPYLSI